jgi:hypothetical protein
MSRRFVSLSMTAALAVAALLLAASPVLAQRGGRGGFSGRGLSGRGLDGRRFDGRRFYRSGRGYYGYRRDYYGYPYGPVYGYGSFRP